MSWVVFQKLSNGWFIIDHDWVNNLIFINEKFPQEPMNPYISKLWIYELGWLIREAGQVICVYLLSYWVKI